MGKPDHGPAGHGFADVCVNGTEYPEPLPGMTGFGYTNSTASGIDTFHDYSIVDHVIIPLTLEPGDYLLSWRWDCEQTTQIWQNCADVRILSSMPLVAV